MPTVKIQAKHKCYSVLLTQRKAVKKKGDRIDLLTAVIKLSVKTYIPPSMLEDEELHHWHCLTTAFTDKPRSWTMEKLADSVCRFNTILQRSNFAHDKLRFRYPKPITNFMSFMIEVHKEAEVALNENIQSTRVKLGTQKGCGRIQDNVDLTILHNDSFDVDNCAYCKHRFVLPIGLDINEITTYNNKVARQHSEKMRERSNTATK